MADRDSTRNNGILNGDDVKMVRESGDLPMIRGISRREFMKYSSGTVACLYLGTLVTGCGSGNNTSHTQLVQWPISKDVFTTAQRQVLPVPVSASAPQINPRDLALYSEFGYDAWNMGPGLPHTLWNTIAPDYNGAPNVATLLSFFTMTDIHIADKESPAQPLYVGWIAENGPNYNTSAWSPVVLASTHVLDAAMQTINAVHKTAPFDFGISLGDACNNTQYNELRWYLDVIDGKVITPCSGANIGAAAIDYQKPYKAAGLDKSIPWYQVVGNHDQFWMGSFFENAKTLAAHTSDTVIDMAYDPASAINAMNGTGFYMGVTDGSDPRGAVILSGPEGSFAAPPKVAADPNRRSLSTLTDSGTNWMNEFFNTTSAPVGHGFGLVKPNDPPACYSFVPKANIPIKVIVLDDTVKGPGQPNYAAGCLDQPRLDWLQAELQAGQDNNQLMIIAAHIPFNPYQNLVTDPAQAASSPPHMKLFIPKPYPGATSVVDDASLLAFLQGYPNLIMWIAGHRHMNTVTPQIHPTDPTLSFWEVETSSLRDFPQQFRMFNICRNSDNTVSIIITNVDPAVATVSPATTSRGSAVAAARISAAVTIDDATSQSINAELVVQLTPAMQAIIANAGTPV